MSFLSFLKNLFCNTYAYDNLPTEEDGTTGLPEKVSKLFNHKRISRVVVFSTNYIIRLCVYRLFEGSNVYFFTLVMSPRDPETGAAPTIDVFEEMKQHRPHDYRVFEECDAFRLINRNHSSCGWVGDKNNSGWWFMSRGFSILPDGTCVSTASHPLASTINLFQVLDMMAVEDRKISNAKRAMMLKLFFDTLGSETSLHTQIRFDADKESGYIDFIPAVPDTRCPMQVSQYASVTMPTVIPLDDGIILTPLGVSEARNKYTDAINSIVEWTFTYPITNLELIDLVWTAITVAPTKEDALARYAELLLEFDICGIIPQISDGTTMYCIPRVYRHPRNRCIPIAKTNEEGDITPLPPTSFKVGFIEGAAPMLSKTVIERMNQRVKIILSGGGNFELVEETYDLVKELIVLSNKLDK